MQKKEKEQKVGYGRGVVAENPMPTDFENIGLSKAEFIKKQKRLKEKEEKIREYSKELDKGGIDDKKPKDVVQESPKKGRRPKKID